MKYTTPKEVFTHIRDVYEKYDKLDDVYECEEKCSYYMCNALVYLHYLHIIDEELRDTCTTIIRVYKPTSGFMVESDLWKDGYVWMDGIKAKRENRENEYLKLKMRFIDEVILPQL